MMKQEKQAVTNLIRPKLSNDEKNKKSENEARMRKRRDEDINSILIADISEYLEAYKDDEKIQKEIEKYRVSSRAIETFDRLESEKIQRDARKFVYGGDPIDDRETFQDDWWKTDALIKVANDGVKADEKQKRRRAVKDFFYKYSGRKFIDSHNKKKNEKKDIDDMVEGFLGKVALESFKTNSDNPLSVNMYDFLHYVISYKKWRLIISPSDTYKLLSKFKKQYENEDAVLEHSPLTAKLLKDLYHFFRKHHK